MLKIEPVSYAFNTGVFDRDKLHRLDVQKVTLAASRQTNILSDSIGRGFLRPGTEKLNVQLGVSRLIPFVTGEDAYVLDFSDEVVRVLSASGLQRSVVTYGAVTATGPAIVYTVASGTSTSNSGGFDRMSARGRGAVATIIYAFSVFEGGAEHVVRIDVDRGPVQCIIRGSATYFQGVVLNAGTHYFAFNPAGDFSVALRAEGATERKISSVTIYNRASNADWVANDGELRLPSPYAAADLRSIRTEQSLDVMWLAADGYPQQMIQRHGNRSWSLVDYTTDDGPFNVGRSANVRLKASVLEGNGTLTADDNFFTSDMVGTLFRLDHPKQRLDTYLATDSSYTDAFKVTGITETNFVEREWTYTIAGTWVGTLRCYRSFDGEFGDYHQFRRAATVATVDITANASYTNDDNDDNAEIWYKIGFEDASYTSGEAHVTLTYPGGTGYGIARVVGFTSATVVDIEVLRPFKAFGYTDEWRQGRWSAQDGTYPASVALSDGRLVWSGEDLIDASISDAYEAFDETFIGDAGPISRSIAVGGRNKAQWMMGVSPLVIGCDTRTVAVQASSLDEVLSPSNFKVKNISKIGAAPYSPCELNDGRILFAHGTGIPFEMTPSNDTYVVAPYSIMARNLVTSEELVADMIATPHATDAKTVEMATQRVPDQRIWSMNDSGRMVCILDEPNANVIAAHIPIETADTDTFNSVCTVSVGGVERVFLSVYRNGSYVMEKLALDSEAVPGTICKVMDSFVSDAAPSPLFATITGLDHLEGREVVAWVDGAPVTDDTITDLSLDNSMVFTVSGGSITLPVAPTLGYCVGLRYVGQYQSGRLGGGIQGYSPLLKNKSIASVGFLMADWCRSGFWYGTTDDDSTFNAPWSLPALSTATGDTANEITIGPAPDEDKVPSDSKISPDTRLCFTGASPKPFAVLAITMAVQTL